MHITKTGALEIGLPDRPFLGKAELFLSGGVMDLADAEIKQVRSLGLAFPLVSISVCWVSSNMPQPLIPSTEYLRSLLPLPMLLAPQEIVPICRRHIEMGPDDELSKQLTQAWRVCIENPQADCQIGVERQSLPPVHSSAAICCEQKGYISTYQMAFHCS